ncbi:YpiB family protein [Desulforamulus putei]|uniref:Uncharacterized protein YpiB, UPF0302 family n=1 Tax=Desulforamulus putei DSM 12395 TaxID=1121429 RepID=A0A1M4VX02_9FIRM|nr:YpiB family protein [Desulforamulus putei]SHE73477.1 Uncharacterized protein YpiB, UPF0302 family [Desulforamulus putei DSM 12395]
MLANSLAEKRELIVWFLRTNRLKKPEAARILEYIRDNKNLLARVEFTNKLSDKKDALLVSAVYTNTFPFDFRLNNVSYGSVDEVLHQLKNNPPKKLFMWLSYASPPGCKLCARSNKRQVKAMPNPVSAAHRMLVEAVRTVNRREARRKALMARIDKSLDEKNLQEFKRLTEELQRLSYE